MSCRKKLLLLTLRISHCAHFAAPCYKNRHRKTTQTHVTSNHLSDKLQLQVPKLGTMHRKFGQPVAVATSYRLQCLTRA